MKNELTKYVWSPGPSIDLLPPTHILLYLVTADVNVLLTYRVDPPLTLSRDRMETGHRYIQGIMIYKGENLSPFLKLHFRGSKIHDR